jgi:hypothetical protein
MSARAAQRVTKRAPAKKKLSIVEPSKKAQRRLPWLVIISLICVFTVIFGVLFARVVLVKSSFKLQKLQNNLTAAEELHEELMLEAAKLESPAQIERKARALGMVDPVAINYIVADIPQRHENRIAYSDLPNSVSTTSTVAAIAGESP